MAHPDEPETIARPDRSSVSSVLEWTDLAAPSDAEVHRICAEVEVPPEFVTAPSERPRLEMLGDVTLVVMHFPVLAGCEGELVTHEVRMLLAGERMVTIHAGTLPAFARVRALIGEVPSPDLPARLLRELVNTWLEVIDLLDAELARLEQQVFETDGKRDHIRDVMTLQRHACSLYRVVRAQLDVFASIARDQDHALPVIVGDAFDRVLPTLRHIQILVEGLQSRASIIREANDAFLSHTLNNTLRVLTVFSVIMIPPTLIAGVFGMNVPVPLQGNSLGFAAVVVTMMLVVAGFLIYLRRKSLV